MNHAMMPLRHEYENNFFVHSVIVKLYGGDWNEQKDLQRNVSFNFSAYSHAMF